MSDHAKPPTIADLFLGFFTIGMFGFGGVLPWARRMIVEQRRWLSAAEFTDMLGLCQFLPGGNIMNVTIALGARFHGVPGAAAAFLGLMTAPVAIVIGLGAVYERYADLATVRHGFAALAAAAAALVLSTALKIAAPLRTRPLEVAVGVVTFLAIAVLRLPLPLALPVLAAISTILLWRVGQ
ncbi:MAG: chromate transporter [Acetobacteraceae bacterium]|nr:chromate transporter [Acetobacteraceae bacterium]